MSATRRILVAEDSPTQAERIRLVLEEAGYEVELAGSGREGVDKTWASPPDLIISDVVMPEIDGFAFCQVVKSDPGLRRIPFALLTGQRTPGDILRGIEVGADNFITKPFEDEVLLARVGRIFENLERRRRGGLEMEVTVRVGGREIVVNADKEQMIELLFATSEQLSDSNRQLEEARLELAEQARGLERTVEERTRELDQQRAFLKQVIDINPSFVFAKDRQGRFTLANRAMAEAYGTSVEALIGKTDADCNPRAEEVEWFRRADLEVMDTGREKLIPDEVITDASGRQRWLQTVKRPLVGPNGRVDQVLGVSTDITERKRTEEQLFLSQKLEAVGQLAGGVAHDFNNILGAITGFGELAQRQLPAGHPVQGRLEQILRASHRAAEVTRQLLAFSRRQVMQPKVLDLGAVLAEVEKLLRRLIGEDIVLGVRSAPDLGHVKVDPTQLEQVILNLAVNARDAMPKGGTLTIETANVEHDEEYVRRHVVGQPGRYVMLAVSDTGIGMDAATQARIFEPFFTTKPEGTGTGLGLATVYGIVKQSGGYIWVYSEPDHGTTFKVYLPRVDAPLSEVLVPAARAEAPRGTDTILVVEDQEALREMIREVLEEQGYTVLEASAGEEALAVAREHRGPIHLLLTDVVMPRMSGRELAERLASVRPETRALYMSGYSNGTISDRGMLAEGAALIEKPFTTESLARAVRETLDGPSA